MEKGLVAPRTSDQARMANSRIVEKGLVAPRTSDQARMANSRIVSEKGTKFDFTLAIFREWFAARAIVERTVSIHEIDLNSDRWVTPLAIAINSENPNIGPEIMERLSSTDPGMAGLVLEEVSNNWSVVKPVKPPPLGTAIEAGTSIRNAMENWRTGLEPLMDALEVLDQNGNIPTLGIEVKPGRLTTSWYRGHETLAPVVQLPEGINDPSKGLFWNWHRWHSRDIELTRVAPWQITQEDLSELLSEELRTLHFAQATKVGLQEFAHEFTSFLRRSYHDAKNLKTSAEVIGYVEDRLSKLGGDPRSSVTFGHKDYTWNVPRLEHFKERVFELADEGIDILVDPWPGPDKEWPPGKTGGMWFERYTEERLLQRTNTIFNGALRIYNNIVDQWLPAFNKRDQMSHALPFRLRGELRLPPDQERRDRNEPFLIYWPEWTDDANDSGVFIELGPKEPATEEDTQYKILAAQEKFFELGKAHYSVQSVLPGYEARPATTLAQKWLRADLDDIHWVKH